MNPAYIDECDVCGAVGTIVWTRAGELKLVLCPDCDEVMLDKLREFTR